MPHVCTRCNNVFESGEDILKGCPVCGWKKFMFTRTRSAGADGKEPQAQQIITRAMGVRVPPGGRAEEGASESMQKPSEKPFQPSGKGPEASSPEGEKSEKLENNPEMDSQLESIKITAPGTYELNLPSLFEREELIMAVKEGTYFIDLSSAFRKGKKE